MGKKRLYSPKYAKEILRNHNFTFSKSLGQNFLVDGNIVRKICEEGNITKEDNILEIGPGIGTLTEELSLRAKKVVAIEIDDNLLPILSNTLKGYSNIEIIHEDVLKINLRKVMEEKFDKGDIKVVANLPYYITTPIIGRLIEEELGFHSIIVMVQKEVADRIIAAPGSKDFSSLSVFVQYYTKPEIILKVPKSVFMPKPKVNSAVLKLNLKKEKINLQNKELFFKVVKSAFSQRRKTLVNSLNSKELGVDKEGIRNVLEKSNIDPKKRAEDLSVEDFAKISSNLPPLDIY